jgi:hypothetical protein
MGQTNKVIIAFMIFGLVAAYAGAIMYVNEAHGRKMAEMEFKTALYDLKKEQLYRQATNLQTVKVYLTDQLEAKQKTASAPTQSGGSKQRVTSHAPAMSQTNAEAAANVTAPSVQINTNQANQLLERIKKLNQGTSKSSSSSSSSGSTRRVTRAS